jgi:hypothetical protein
VPNSVCMARSGEDGRHVRRLVDHISPKLCRRESAGRKWMSFAIPNNTGSQSRRACDISRWHTQRKCWFDRLTQVIDKRSTTVTFVRRSDLSHYAVPATSSATARRSRSPVEIEPEAGHPLAHTAKQASSRRNCEKLAGTLKGRIEIKKHLTSMTPILSPPNERR